MTFLTKKSMFNAAMFVVFSGFILLVAHSSGQVGATQFNGDGCTCHGDLSTAVTVTITGPDELAPGAVGNYTVTINGGPLVRAGTNIAASSGTLAIADNSLKVVSTELTHTSPKLPSGGAVTFAFKYTAPATAGTVTLYANGNSVNFGGSPEGDQWNFAPNKTVTVQSSSTVQVGVGVASGWNLVSVPVAATPMTPAGVFPTSNSSMFSFANGYTAVSALVNGLGYWARFPSAQTVTVSGTAIATKTIPVIAGWNIIGFFNSSVQTSSITSAPAGIISSSFFGYDNGYTQATTLAAGKGYWIRVSQNGTLTIP
ncbi:MAG: hypothetical protein HY965_08985 [Ignavibacteriales bacterium]|nr:hypothetical protein [Ignavibacteriales bacterium]